MTGVAQAADSIDDLASFLGGEPEEAREDEDEAEDGQPDEEDQEEGEPDESADEEEAEEQPEEQAARKIKVPVKGEDGQETVEELDESELVSGYMRQKAFTQKTMELADKERQAAEIVQQRVAEASQYAQQQAEIARAAVVQLAGLRSEAELSRLAIEDPAAWIQETERIRQVGSILQQLDAQIAAEKQATEQATKQKEQAQIAEAWKVLNEKGIDRQKLGDIYGNVMKTYGVTNDQLGKLIEPGLALALKDALAYRELQAKKPQITQKVKEVERLPTTKKALPPKERTNRALGEKFSRGRAKVDDLASFLANNRM